MKKVLLIFTIVFTVAFTVTSCKKDKNTDSKEELATKIYQCPMDCEKGKSYTEEGSCPVCKMDLKEKKPGQKVPEEKAAISNDAEKHKHKDGEDHGHEH